MEEFNFTLTKAEQKAVKDMEHAFKILGRRHWFFAGSGDGVLLMRCCEEGGRSILPNGSMNPDYCVCSIGNVDIDGGDF